MICATDGDDTGSCRNRCVAATTTRQVYLVKSEKSNQNYDHWLCGGAIVSPTHILTSAACLSDVTYVYAIAGYNKYVKSEHLNLDDCTRERKQKVVKTCVPKSFIMNYQSTINWVSFDIGFAVVEKPYNFSDVTYRRTCSYVPAPIKINYEAQYQKINTNMFIYGWGHKLAVRSPGDNWDYNQQYLQQTTTRVADQNYCASYFINIAAAVNRSMICCNGPGYINWQGNIDGPAPTNQNGCRRNREGKCDDILYYDYGFDSRRNKDNTSNNTDSRNKRNRRQGVICQNDHGSPLVTWVGAEEYVVGVAVTSLVTAQLMCMGPQLFTSTHCSSFFIKCVLKDFEINALRRMCDMGKDTGYEIHETELDWNKIEGDQDDEIIRVKNVATNSNRETSDQTPNNENDFDANDNLGVKEKLPNQEICTTEDHEATKATEEWNFDMEEAVVVF